MFDQKRLQETTSHIEGLHQQKRMREERSPKHNAEEKSKIEPYKPTPRRKSEIITRIVSSQPHNRDQRNKTQ